MSFLSKIFSALWRIWFLLAFAIPFLLTLPITFFLTLSEKTYPLLYHLFVRPAASFMLFVSGIYPEVKKIGKLDPNKQYIFCPNHASLLDVPMMFYLSKKPILFIGKKSIAKIPIFGYYYASFNVLVDRASARDSYLAFQRAGKHIKNGKNMVIFPEGGIPKTNVQLNRFKTGAFRMAIEDDVSIIPITFADNKKVLPESITAGGPKVSRITIHKEVSPEGKNMEQLKKEVFEIIQSELIEYGN